MIFRSLISLVVQQFFVPVITFLCLLATAPISSSPDSTGVYSGTLVSCIAGFGLGFLVKKFLPRMAEEGRLIWVLPAALFTLAFCSDLFRRDFSYARKVFFSPEGEGEVGLAFVLITLPTYSCIAYSIAASSHVLNFLKKPKRIFGSSRL